MAMFYTKDHEWVRIDGDTATVGISEHAQEQLGDVVFVELPAVGTELAKGGQAAVVESVKAASEIYAPISGEVTESNTGLEEDPALVNKGAESEGWFFKLKVHDPGETAGLMDRGAYEAYLESIA
jgi:glycine cleavage system H protein